MNEHQVFSCHLCCTPATTYTKEGLLNNHNKNTHSHHRTNTNVAQVLKIYRNASEQTWTEALAWLQNLTPTPAPYRTSLERHMSGGTKIEYIKTMNHVFKLAGLPNAPHPTLLEEHPPSQTNMDPFWVLLGIMDQLILFPNDKRNKRSPNEIIKERLILFRKGKLRQLYERAHAYQPPNSSTNTTPIVSGSLNHSAQLAADEDNYHTAYARITSSMPVASMTQEVEDNLRKLYPTPTTYVPETTDGPRTRSSTSSAKLPMFQASRKQVIIALRRIKKAQVQAHSETPQVC